MSRKASMLSRSVNGISVDQKVRDGFINGTTMSVAYDKDLNDWFTTKDTFELFFALAVNLGTEIKFEVLSKIMGISVEDATLQINSGDFRNLDVSRLSGSKYAQIFPGLVSSRRGSPENGGGTWLHPDLAVQLAQWCNKPFAIQVSRWVREWWNSNYNPIQLEADADRVQTRDKLKDEKRLEFAGQIKAFLLAAGRYKPGSFQTKKAFWEAHDKLNTLLTTETAGQMRERLAETLGRAVSEQELLRDYFPITNLADYAALCQAAANEMATNKTSPLKAIDIAARQALSHSYVAKPIDFAERISLVRRRLEQKDQLLIAG